MASKLAARFKGKACLGGDTKTTSRDACAARANAAGTVLEKAHYRLANTAFSTDAFLSLRTLKILTTKSVRFALVVETCGAPQVYIPWQSPKEDRRLQAQIRQ